MIPVNMATNGEVIERTDACLGVRFLWEGLLNETKSNVEGRPIYEQTEMIEVTFPGDKTTILKRKVKDEDKVRFGEKYRLFSMKENDKLDGTPISQFPFISDSERKELEYYNIYTAEQFISVPDGRIDSIGVNGREMIKKIKAYMNAAKDNAIVTQMTTENDSLKKEMALMKEQMNQILRMKQDEAPSAEVKEKKVKRN